MPSHAAMAHYSHLHHLAPSPGDSVALLLDKQRQLLLLLQVYEAWAARADGTDAVAPEPTANTSLTSNGNSYQDQPAPQQQHAAQLLRQLLGTDSTEDQAVADRQQQSDQAPQPAQQQHDGALMPPPPAVQPPTSNKELLTRLLMPGAARLGAPAPAAASLLPPKQQQPVGQGRMRRLQQQNRRSLLGVPGSSMPAGSTAAAAAADYYEAFEESPGPLQQQQLLHMRANYLLDAQSQAPGAGAAAAGAASLPHFGLTAQQQLLSPHTATHAPLLGAGSGGGYSPQGSSGPRQQCKDSCQQHDGVRQQQQEQPEEIEVTPAQPRAAKSAAPVQAPTAQQQQQWGSGVVTAGAGPDAAGEGGCAARQPAAVAATPDALLDREHVAAAAAAASAAAGRTADTPATVRTELVAAAGSRRAAAAADLAAALFHTPNPPGAGTRARTNDGAGMLPPLAAARRGQGGAADSPGAAAAAASGAQGPADTEELAETPPSLLASGAPPAAPPQAAGLTGAAAALGGCSQLDETQPPSQQQVQLQQDSLRGAGAYAGVPSQVPATPASDTSSVPVSVLQHQQQQQWQAHQHGRATAARAATAAARGAAGTAAALLGHMHTPGSSRQGITSAVLDHQQQRVRELRFGRPVEHILCCSGYAAVLLREPSLSSTYRVVLLGVASAATGVMVSTAGHASVPLCAAQQPAAAGARRLGLTQQPQHSKVAPDLLRTGLLLLPAPAAGKQHGSSQPAGPLLAVASELQLLSGGDPATAAAAAAGSAAVTPGLSSQAGQGTASKTGSSGKRKLPRPAVSAGLRGGLAAGGDVSPAAGADSGHAVSIYQLQGCRDTAGLRAQAGGQCTGSPGAALLQRLPTAFAVRCLAVSHQAGLLAAAGAGGFACVWRLSQQQQQQQPGPADWSHDAGAGAEAAARAAVVADTAALVLPAACYHAIVFPDVAEVCFITQEMPGACAEEQQQHGQHDQLQQHSPGCGAWAPQLPGHRVLLAGCCSRGPVAVWDLALGQQIMAVHSPDLRLTHLMPLPPPAARAAAAAAEGVAGVVRAGQQQAAGPDEPVACLLAHVRSVDSGLHRRAAGAKQEAQPRQLRAVALHSNGDMQTGCPLMAAGSAGGVCSTALSGSTAAVAAAGGVVQVWDVVSGMRHLCMRHRKAGACDSSGGGADTVALLPLGGGAGWAVSSPAVKGAEQSESRMAVLAGSASGVLTVALL